MSIKFLFKGPVAAVFDLIRRELRPNEEFDVPEEHGLAFDNHGHCECLEPEKLQPLRDAEAAAEKALADARAATGLVNAHPAAPTATTPTTARGNAVPSAPPPQASDGTAEGTPAEQSQDGEAEQAADPSPSTPASTTRSRRAAPSSSSTTTAQTSAVAE